MPRPVARVALITLALGLCAAAAVAQSVAVGTVADAGGGSALVRVSGLAEGDVTVDAWTRLGRTLAFGTAWRGSQTFGPIGNVVIEGGADALLEPGSLSPFAVRLWGGLRGVVGTVAASLRLDAGTDDEDAFEPLARSDATRALASVTRGDWDVGARLGVTIRLERTTILTIEPRVRLAAGTWSWGAAAGLRHGGLADDLDLLLGAEGVVAAGRATAAVSVGTVLTRRREPDSWLRLWLGVGDGRLLPGAEALVAGRVGSASWSLSAAAVPHRVDVRPYRLAFETAFVPVSAADGTWRVRAAAALAPDLRPAMSLAIVVERPLALRRTAGP